MKDKMAVISLGGKQHLVSVGSKVNVNRLSVKEGENIDAEALMIAEGEKSAVGTPVVDGAKVSLKVLEHSKGDKVTVARFRAKSRFRRKVGHRQPLTTLEVVAIKA